jgi:Zn finger protein HypA/HybF involved in hydrogenase expression
MVRKKSKKKAIKRAKRGKPKAKARKARPKKVKMAIKRTPRAPMPRAPKLRMKIIKAEMICPSCRISITLPYEVEDGEIINCPDCDAELQVIKMGRNVSLRKLAMEYGESEHYETGDLEAGDYE